MPLTVPPHAVHRHFAPIFPGDSLTNSCRWHAASFAPLAFTSAHISNMVDLFRPVAALILSIESATASLHQPPNSHIQGIKFIHLVNIPKYLCAVPSVVSTVAVGAQSYAGVLAALFGVVRLVDCRKVYAEQPGVDVIVAGLEVSHA